jgi:RNA polymerase sigma-70 factor (ECF subfamily)
MIARTVAFEPSAAAAPDAAVAAREQQRAFVERHHAFVSRVLWSQGTPRSHLDDAVQQVFMVALKQLESIRDERPFLFGVAARVARETARSVRRHPVASEPEVLEREASPDPSGEELLDKKRARELLDRVLDGLPQETRVVFVLYEIEGLKLEEIASVTGVPRGTVSSRLRRGRELFQAATRRMKARMGKESLS